MVMDFALLNIISCYSFLQSGLSIPKIASAGLKKGYFGLGLVDNSFLYGVPEFVKAVNKNKQKYIFGITVNLSDQYAIYAINEIGYRNIIAISKEVSLENLDLEFLINHLSGTILVLETNYGEFKNKFPDGLDEKYLHYLAKISKYPEQFYLGLEITSKSEFNSAQKIREFASLRGYELIAFPKILYENSQDAIVLKMVEAIANEEKLEQKELKGQQYFQDIDSYKKLYTRIEIANTVKVISSNTLDFNIKRGEMVHFPVDDSKLTIKQNVLQGLKDKGIDDETHLERALYELDVIISMGYEDYFLIVADYVNYAKNHNILVGPGRGSAAGSLVSYALGITEVDPLKYDLQFERFLNKARKSMPDIDIDFMDISRDDMVQYMRDKYGENRVASIVTFQTIKAKQALRDAGRLLDVPTRHIDMLSKSITEHMSLREAYKKLETFRKLVDSDKYFLDIVSMASKIENLPRQSGQHAAGIILNNSPIDEVLPITIDLDNHYISQYEKDYLEEQGFLKMDFLSLRNLTTIDICLKLIEQNQNKKISMYDIPYEDPHIFELIRGGNTAGIFQLESSGMKGAIKIIEPIEFNDIVVLLSLFRPGPMDNIKEYKQRSIGKIPVSYASEDIKKVLGPTYGIIIYQEQISKLATVMAGFSLEEADLFRRAVSHKEKEVLLSAQKDFINGAKSKGYSNEVATNTFNDILKFANYGFNKSHAVVYAIIACRMAYLKYYYPLEFYVSLLSTSSMAIDSKFSEYLSEMNKRGLRVYSPDINASTSAFILKEDGILFPLSFIKGISALTSNKIVEERMLNGEYKDFYDFVIRGKLIGINETIIAKLIDSGAFDKLYPSRQTLRESTLNALQLAELLYTKDGQIILDTTLEGSKNYFISEDDPLNNLSLEYDALGLMLSDNPLRYKKELLASLHALSLEEVKGSYGKVVTAGIISYIKTIKTKKNSSTMAFIKIFDESGELECTIFPKLFADTYTLLIKNNALLLKGRYDRSNGKETFVVDELSKLEEQ